MSEKQRLERRKQLAAAAVQEFEDQLSNQELILLRLDALPEDLRESNHDEVRAVVEQNIERLKKMIAAMRSEAAQRQRPKR